MNYGYDEVIPNMDLQDEIAEVYAEIVSVNGIRYYDFDGFEFFGTAVMVIILLNAFCGKCLNMPKNWEWITSVSPVQGSTKVHSIIKVSIMPVAEKICMIRN